jgi:hypothetical protein
MSKRNPDSVQPVDAFEEALAELQEIDAAKEEGYGPEYRQRLYARLRAARFPKVTDDALEEAILMAALHPKSGAVQRFRTLFAAALQQHPTGCYSREEVLALILQGIGLGWVTGCNDPKGEHPTQVFVSKAAEMIDEHDAKQEKGKP